MIGVVSKYNAVNENTTLLNKNINKYIRGILELVLIFSYNEPTRSWYFLESNVLFLVDITKVSAKIGKIIAILIAKIENIN
jgi:hypothetical protein